MGKAGNAPYGFSRRGVAPKDNMALIFHRTLVGGSNCHHRYKWAHCGAGDIAASAVWGFVAEVVFVIT